jgi:hypothetical protein
MEFAVPLVEALGVASLEALVVALENLIQKLVAQILVVLPALQSS